MAMAAAISAFALLLFLWPASVIFFSYFLTPRRIRITMAKQGVTGPKPRFLLGNLPDVAALVSTATAGDMDAGDHNIVGRLLPHYVLWSKIYGKRFVFWYGSEPRLCLTDTDLIKEFLSAKGVHLSGKSWLQRQGTKHFIGQGLLMANGDQWLHQRHVVAPAFMGEKLKSHMGYMIECTKKTMETLRTAAEIAGKNGLVEIGEHLTRLAGDIIFRTEFDTSYEKGRQIFHHLTRLQSLTAQSSRHLWIPGSRFIPSKFRREIKSLKEEVEKLLMEIIESRREGVEIGRSSSYGKGLLGLLLAETTKKETSSYSLQKVMDECKTFFFAGHETSALLLTWTVMLLATNPAWQEKARAEVASVCSGEPPAADHLPKLNLLQMIINESLRLYPPATLLPRMAFEDTKLGDLFVPRGLSIWIPVLAIHHDEEIWGEDAHRFNPARFAARSFAANRHFLPFAAGPRNCVGQAYAMAEAKIVLAMLLANFRFAISESYRHAPVNVLTLRPKYGVPVHLTPVTASS
ncbi:Cytokinin hydroxylase [Apostasia shenzhenica]|uniref:Cytokinin hydroxylase n=1 Tax=Apostasia shenzhenica TaxID=1088818 RepID=A0A2H9ZV06_9ASPA|nr:Cytokinin hydroxylase [Apostasia shenzhenica]